MRISFTAPATTSLGTCVLWSIEGIRAPMRGLLLAAAIVVASSAIVDAQEDVQAWIPDVLTFPDDAEIVTDRTVGSTVRLFSISTDADVDALLTDWEDKLSENGYPVTRASGDLIEQSIEFTGPGIANAKIIVSPMTDGGRRLIEFDATLN